MNVSAGTWPSAPPQATHCRHCGNPVYSDSSEFCCSGCDAVYTMLNTHGLLRYYELEDQPGVTPETQRAEYSFLTDSAIQDKLLDYSLQKSQGITLNIPAIHCAACVWLLENLFKIHPGIGRSEVQFGKRRLRVQFDPEQITLQELATLLDTMGYPPIFSLHDASAEEPIEANENKKLLLRVAAAGFCFGNVMLFSFPFYLGLTPGSSIQAWSFSVLSILLSLPVLVYSADVFWKKALSNLKVRQLSIEVPITLGLIALFTASLAEIFIIGGEGYLDSLTGLVFLLLCGRVFQNKTFNRMVFDRDYRSYFPISIIRIEKGKEITIPLSTLTKGDRIRVRCGELVPADSRLDNDEAVIDYSFITGESEPVIVPAQSTLYAGGRVCGNAIRATVTKDVDQGYLTGLWNQDSKSNAHRSGLTLTNKVSPWFTAAILIISIMAAVAWLFIAPEKAAFVFAAVLIVACPCALALSAPFVYGQALRLLGAKGIFLKSSEVIENLAGIRSILFDKTGTLTSGYTAHFKATSPIASNQLALLKQTAAQSAHPYCCAISEDSASGPQIEFTNWNEQVAQGIQAEANGQTITMGKPSWLRDMGINVPEQTANEKGCIAAAIDHCCVGTFIIEARFRSRLGTVMNRLAEVFPLGLVSGDHQSSKASLSFLDTSFSECWMEQSPSDKAQRVREWQKTYKSVMMIGDGLNDSAALQRSNVGMVVSDDTGMFCPASDIIIESHQLTAVPNLIRFAKRAVSLTTFCIILSLLYNVVGITIAVTGHLSPLVAAVLMPLSSFTIIALAMAGTRLAARELNKETA